jgi:DNA-binding transcriptional MerR regulator
MLKIREKVIKEAQKKARQLYRLIQKRGERILMIPYLRKEGVTLEGINEILKLGVTREQIRLYLVEYWPGSLYPKRPPNLYSTSQLLKLLGRKDPKNLKALLERHGITPKGKLSGKLLWGKDAYKFLINRRCLNCGKPLPITSSFRRQYCNVKCKLKYQYRRRKAKGVRNP